MQDEVGRLTRLVRDLQELSRAEAKQLALHPSRMTCAALIAQVVARLAPQYAEKTLVANPAS